MTPSQKQQLDKIREDWKPGARLTTWGPKDAAESINLLLTLLDQAQRDTERVEKVQEEQRAAILQLKSRVDSVNPGHGFGSFGDSVEFLCDAHEELKVKLAIEPKVREAFEFAGSLIADSKFNGFSDLVTYFRDTPLYKEAKQALDQAALAKKGENEKS